MPTCPAPAGYLYVVGAHGGAGESTIAAWTHARATGRRWPVSATWSAGGQPSPDGGVVDVLLVARTHSAGLTAARTVLKQWATGRLPANRLHGLVLVPDAPGRLPKPLAELAELVAGGAPRAWLLPWLDPLRLVTDPREITGTGTGTGLVLPHAVATFVRDLQALLTTTTAAPAAAAAVTQ